jgi:hypothetical protein
MMALHFPYVDVAREPYLKQFEAPGRTKEEQRRLYEEAKVKYREDRRIYEGPKNQSKLMKERKAKQEQRWKEQEEREKREKKEQKERKKAEKADRKTKPEKKPLLSDY